MPKLSDMFSIKRLIKNNLPYIGYKEQIDEAKIIVVLLTRTIFISIIFIIILIIIIIIIIFNSGI